MVIVSQAFSYLKVLSVSSLSVCDNLESYFKATMFLLLWNYLWETKFILLYFRQ